MILAKATWTEVEALDREQVVVIPIGATEQQGLSLPLGARTVLAERIASALEVRLADEVLVVPSMPYGVSGADAVFAGTVDLGFEAFAATIRAIVTAFARHRFRKFLVLLGSDGDSYHATRLALRKIKDESPTLQLAVEFVGTPADQWGDVLGAIDTTLVRVIPEGSPQLDLETDSEFVGGQFVTDSQEDGGALRPVTAPPDLDVGRKTLAWRLQAVVDLVRTMRDGRVYMQSEPDDDDATEPDDVTEFATE